MLRFPFVQLEIAGTVGLDEGRYLGRDPERVLVVGIDNPAPAPRRRLGRAKPKDADPRAAAPPVPMTTLTVITPTELGDAEAWLGQIRDDDDEIDALIAAALELVNGAIHAHRAAVGDSSIPDVAAEAALAVRIGFGTGEDLADGHFTEAVEIPASERRRRRVEALRPTERVASVLAGRESVATCELLLLRARSDLDAGRAREGALQLRSGVAAMLAERDGFRADGQAADLEALMGSLDAIAAAADGALSGEPSAEHVEVISAALAIAERVLRRERASR